VDINCFKSEIAPLLANYELRYSSFRNGDFGDLERIEIEGFNKLGTVELWSKGWLSIDVYDCILDIQLINLLLEPIDIEEQKKAIETLLKVLINDE